MHNVTLVLGVQHSDSTGLYKLNYTKFIVNYITFTLSTY